MNLRSIIIVIAVAALATALAVPVQAAESTKTTKTPAEGSFDLILDPSAFAVFQRAGLSIYSIGGPRVDLGDSGDLGMEFDVRAVDGTGRTFTDGGQHYLVKRSAGSLFLHREPYAGWRLSRRKDQCRRVHRIGPQQFRSWSHNTF